MISKVAFMAFKVEIDFLFSHLTSSNISDLQNLQQGFSGLRFPIKEIYGKKKKVVYKKRKKLVKLTKNKNKGIYHVTYRK